MLLAVCAFTDTGFRLAKKIEDSMTSHLVKLRENNEDYKLFVEEAFHKHLPVIFIGATGIAVRTIAPFVNDKLTDSPVIVIDEKGQFVIPVLSGHMGRANEIAVEISEAICGTPVITTATDVEKIFSIDIFADKNCLRIENREGIKRVSSKLLKGEEAFIYIEGIESKENVHKNISLVDDEKKADIKLTPKKYVLGIGCKKGKSFEELKAFVEKQLKKNNISINDVGAICSIDLKSREEGLLTLAHFLHLPFITFSAERLEAVEGEFTESGFVKEVTGVSNVCERAALCFDKNGELTVRKTAENGMTFAVAKYEGRSLRWEI